MSLTSTKAAAAYWVPKLAIELGLGTGLSQAEPGMASVAVTYELKQDWALLGHYTYESSLTKFTKSGPNKRSVQQAGVAVRYQVDFLQIKPWLGARVGLSNIEGITPLLGASFGLSYLLLEQWQLSLWGLGLQEPLSRAEMTTGQSSLRFYGLISLSYSFALAEGFDDL